MKNATVLLVDDDNRNVYALESYLEMHDMEVMVATSGLEALKIMDVTIPDIILMDIMMPDMNGYETIKKIRKTDIFKSIPIIAVTANAMKGDREKCLESGASDYLSKPLMLDELISKIKHFIQQR